MNHLHSVLDDHRLHVLGEVFAFTLGRGRGEGAYGGGRGDGGGREEEKMEDIYYKSFHIAISTLFCHLLVFPAQVAVSMPGGWQL